MAARVFQKESVITGHHVYKTVWTPVIGEELHTEVEDDNEHDKYAVAVMKSNGIVGHMPRSLSRISWYFLKNGGKIQGKVTGKRRKGNGLEVPCIYYYEGSPRTICKLRRLLS
uniref:HIRAN domain-containing protein n=1 Tax=Amphimedon queenslandica TaxID=400682 RepID=A0A1X7UNS1_AMPQE